ncbi:TetR/AcrR family transcriptional regulator [Terrisporobacter sp.]
MKLNRGSKQNHNMKEKILLTSIDLMTKNGINNTSLADISREVNISKGTLYYHYASRDDIIFDIADNHLNVISEALLDCLKEINFQFSTEDFVLVVLKNISNIENTGRIHMYLICEAIMANDALRERIGLKYVEWRTTLENQISQIISDKSHAKGASFLLMSVVDGLVIQALLKGEKVPYEEIAKFLIDYSNKNRTTS